MARKISVIITTYNRKKQLKKAVESVLEQSERDFEIIIVDDCSTDGTEETVKRLLQYPKIRYFKTKKNFGHDGQPKNIGIFKAKGEYICFLDDDDVYRKDALKVLSKYLKHSGADVVYGDYLIEDKGKKRIGWSVDFNVSALNKMNYIAMPVVMVKREALLEVGGFNEEIPKYKDWNLWLRLQKRGYSFLHIPIIVAEVSTSEDTISKKYKNDVDENGNYLPTYFNPSDCEIWADKTILGEKKKLKVAVFTLTMNRLDYTKRMAHSMFKLAGYDFDWFVVDQASNDGTGEWVRTHPKIKGYKINNKNKGIAKGWNQAVEIAKEKIKPDILIKIDNDAEMMSDNWLKFLVDLFERNRKIILSPYVEGLEDSPGGVLRRRQSGDQPYVLINDRVLGIVPFLGGICWAAPIEVYDEFKFDEGQFLAGNKDYIISQYAKSIGYSLFYAEELRVSHIDGTLGQQKKYPLYFKEKLEADKRKQ